MKRKKWSEIEEKTLINKYADLQNSGTLEKLRTREKKFKPIADQINSIHHLQDPINFPFNWSWRDVSIKVQNMRHQYLGVKQKIRVFDGGFNWEDGENYWENFIRYKEVFGDFSSNVDDELGFEMIDSDDFDEEGGVCGGCDGGERVLELKEVLMKREERRRKRDFDLEVVSMSRESKLMKLESLTETRAIIEDEWRLKLARWEFERRSREVSEERRWWLKMEEKREEEEMEWRERMLGLQIEHEKRMLQLHADVCQNQMQVFGVVARFLCQFFGGDGLGGELNPSVVQHHRGGDLRDDPECGSDSPPEFL